MEPSPTAPGEPVALSTEQKDYLGLDRDGHGAIPICFRVTGRLDITALQRALSQVLTRHESLRLRFVDTPEGLRQIFPPVTADDCAVQEIASPSGTTAADTARQLMSEPADARARGPVRSWMIHSETGGTLLLIVIDHLANDGWGMSVFIRELLACYFAATRGIHPAGVLSKPVRQYSAHVAEQQKHTAAWAPGQYEYWQRVIRDYRRPTERIRPAVTSGSPDQPARSDLTCVVPPEQQERLAAFTQSVGVTARTVELAGVALALWTWCPTEITRIWSVHSGREDPAVAASTGLYYRHVPVVTRVDPASTLADFTRRVLSDWSEAIGYSGIPYSADAIRRQITPADAAGIGIPEVSLNRRIALFGDPATRKPISVDGSTTIEGVGLAADNWAWYREPRLRIMTTLTDSLSLRAVFNPGITPPGFAVALMHNIGVLLTLFAPEQADRPIGDLAAQAGELATAPSAPAHEGNA